MQVPRKYNESKLTQNMSNCRELYTGLTLYIFNARTPMMIQPSVIGNMRPNANDPIVKYDGNWLNALNFMAK